MRRQILLHSFEVHVKSSLRKQTNAIQTGLVQALMGKDNIISKLKHENVELLEENKLLINTIRELDQVIASGPRASSGIENPDLALRIETLIDEMKLKDDDLYRHQEKIENLTSMLQEADSKKSIFQKENVKLKEEIVTLKHVKLREAEEFNDTINDLREKLNNGIHDQFKRSGKLESPSNKLKRLKAVSIAKEDPRIKSNEILQHEVDGELPKTILIKKSFVEEVTMEEEKETEEGVPRNLIDDSSCGASSSTIGTDRAITSSKIYSTSKSKNYNIFRYGRNSIVCPFKECQKPRKNKEYLEKHLANDHFSMDISKKFTFRKPNEKCRFCEAIINSVSTHFYHYAFVHKELSNILDLDDPRRDLLINRYL